MNTTVGPSREPSGPVSTSSGAPPRFREELDPARRAVGMALVRDAFRDWMKVVGVEDRVAAEILVAAGEACANVLEHSGARRTEQAPAGWIEAAVEAGVLQVVVVDHGKWIERDPTAFARRNRGRGRLLMAGLVDQCSISSGVSGTTVTLRRSVQPVR